MGNITIEAQRSSAASTTDNSTATSQYDDDQERRDLYNFVTNHYVLDTSTGEVHYKCICLYPNNCSIWLHHPNLGETIAELVESATSVTPPAAGTTFSTTTRRLGYYYMLFDPGRRANHILNLIRLFLKCFGIIFLIDPFVNNGLSRGGDEEFSSVLGLVGIVVLMMWTYHPGTKRFIIKCLCRFYEPSTTIYNRFDSPPPRFTTIAKEDHDNNDDDDNMDRFPPRLATTTRIVKEDDNDDIDDVDDPYDSDDELQITEMSKKFD